MKIFGMKSAKFIPIWMKYLTNATPVDSGNESQHTRNIRIMPNKEETWMVITNAIFTTRPLFPEFATNQIQTHLEPRQLDHISMMLKNEWYKKTQCMTLLLHHRLLGSGDTTEHGFVLLRKIVGAASKRGDSRIRLHQSRQLRKMVFLLGGGGMCDTARMPGNETQRTDVGGVRSCGALLWHFL